MLLYKLRLLLFKVPCKKELGSYGATLEYPAELFPDDQVLLLHRLSSSSSSLSELSSRLHGDINLV